MNNCTKCDLHKTRKYVVGGIGPKESGVIILGEAPGYNEDQVGIPFVGDAGKLLDRILIEAGLNRNDLYVDNIVHCRPVIVNANGMSNRAPTTDEVTLCAPYFEAIVKEMRPKLIIPTGNVPLKYLLQDRSITIGKRRGEFMWSEKYQCHIFPVYHPAAILRQYEHYATTVRDFKRVKEFLDNRLPVKSEVNYTFIDTEEKLNTFFASMKEATEFSFDTETTGLDFIKDKIICFSFSCKENTAWCLPYLDSTTLQPYWSHDILPQVKELFYNSAAKIAQNSKFDTLMLKALGIEVNNLVFDTMLAHALLDENAKKLHGLKQMAWTYTDMGGYERPKEEYQKEHKLGESVVTIPYDILSVYAAADADCTFRLYKCFTSLLEKENLTGIMIKLVMPLNTVLLETEYSGVQVDLAAIAALKVKFINDIDRLKRAIFTKVGYELNLNSPKQLIKLLFEDLKFKPLKYTAKKSIATDKSVLKILAKKHDVPRLLLEFRKADKLFSTYINTVNYDANNRVHTHYSMHTTYTGRLTSSAPNLQNIPRDSEIKNMFVAKQGHVFVQLDFSQIEFRFWAHESNDKVMIKDIKAGKDIHRETASVAFGIPIEEITKDQRTAAKNATFGMMYGRGAKSIAEQYNITEEKAKEIINEFFNKYPTAARWIQSIVLIARKQGYLVNFFGRKRRLVGLQNPDKEKQAMAERQAKNFLMQSGAADLTNWLSVRLHPLMKPYNTQLVLNVHDSLVYEVPEEHVHAVVDILNREANRPIGGLRVPLTAEIQIGKKWGDLISPEKYYEDAEEADEDEV